MRQANHNGFALISVLLLMALLMALLVGYFAITSMEMSTTRASMSSLRGFYAAEAGLNLRAEAIRQTFLGYNRPQGTSPNEASMIPICDTGNEGADDFRCVTDYIDERDVSTYVFEPPGNPANIMVPRGEAYQNLNAQEYTYQVFSQATADELRTEAVLEMHFKSRLVPMFQFAAFYNKDLEILPGPAMTLAGPVHTNGDLYVDAGNSLDVLGQITTAGDFYHGRKNANTCNNNPVQVLDPDNLLAIPNCAGGRTQVLPADVIPHNGMIRMNLDPVTVPEPEAIDPGSGNIYFRSADLRIMLDADTGVVTVVNPDETIDGGATANLTGCGVATHHTNFFNNREGMWIDMLDVDMTGLMDCVYANNMLMGARQLDDATEGGLVYYLGVTGANQDGRNNYGVRVFNGAEIRSTSGFAPTVRGLTVVTNQAMYLQGDYNSVRKKPAAFLADSLNVLSNNWNDANSNQALGNRVASDTVINAAFLAGTDSTGNTEGVGGQDAGVYNGGLENYPRFHESWSGRTLRYRGSFVSLNTPRHVDGAWVYGAPQYRAPGRDWGYDTDFDDASQLPPLSPRFVYLKQELFVRHFDL